MTASSEKDDKWEERGGPFAPPFSSKIVGDSRQYIEQRHSIIPMIGVKVSDFYKVLTPRFQIHPNELEHL